MESIVSINLKNINTKETLNDYPILLYLNEDDVNLYNILTKSDEFKRYIIKNVDDVNYPVINIYSCYYDNNIDNNEEIKLNLQQLYKLSDLSEEFWIKYVSKYFIGLYNKSYKLDPLQYRNKNDVNLIKFIYDKLLKKYPQKININLIVNYVLSKIMEDYKELNQENINYIKSKLFTILK